MFWPQYIMVGSHTRLAPTTQQSLPKPSGGGEVDGILAQAETQNIRYRLDDGVPTASTTGFILTAGNDPVFIPVTASGIHVVEDSSGGILQYQWVRVIPSGR